MKTIINLLFITIFIIALSTKTNAQSDPFNPIVYTKPLPSNITVVNQPNDFKFTTHLVNIRIPSDSANIWNVEMEKRYLKRLFNYIKDVDCIILNYSEFYFDESLGLGSLKNGVSHHIMIQNKVQNIGLALFSNANEYNSNKLLGITRLTEDWGLRPQIVTHEFYHQWNSYLESAKYWLVDPSYHTGLVEESNSVFYGYRYAFQHVADSIYSYRQGWSTGFPGKLEGYLAGLWDMPDSLRTLKNYYHYSNLPSELVFDSKGNILYQLQQVKADSIVDLNKTQLFNLYGGERIPNYINANNNYDCAVIIFSLNDFISDNKLKRLHYASILNEFEGTSTEYNNLYDQIFVLGKFYSDINYDRRQTNPYHSSYKKLHFKTRLFVESTDPTLAFPPDGAVNQPTRLTLNWSPTTDAETYRLQVSTNSDFSTTVFDDSTTTTNSRLVGPLANNTTYYWRVKAKNAGGASVWSSVWSFTTIIVAPTAPALASPTNGAVNRPTTLTLSWNPATGAETYRLQVSTSSAFTTPVFDDSTITSTSRQIGPLANNTAYYWRVKAKNTGGASAWSSVWSFTTIIAAPTTPTLISPANGAGNQLTTLTLSWNPAIGATTYRLQISANAAFTTTIFDDSTNATTSRQIGSLTNNTTYYWRVKAKNAGGASAWSSVWSFMTGTTAVSERGKVTPTEFSLNQNYPNPFNPSTTILYALPKTVFVRLTVFNPLGKEVETLLSTTQVAGEYEIHWSPNNLTSGVYLYRLQAGDFVETKKMILMR